MENKAEHQVQEKMEEEEQLRRDHELALALQQQERGEFTTIEMTDSEEEVVEEEDEAESYSSSGQDGGVSFIDSAEFDTEMENLEDGYTDDDDEEEDDIDPDELSYEELMALGEAVGEENRGLSQEEIPSTLSPYVCTNSLQSKITIDRCVICQVEYEQEEQVVALSCVHPFHPGVLSLFSGEELYHLIVALPLNIALNSAEQTNFLETN